MGGCYNYGPFMVPGIVRHLVFRGPQKEHNFDNHPETSIIIKLGTGNPKSSIALS